MVRRYEIAIKQRDEAREEVEMLKTELMKRDRQIHSLETQIENLTVVRTAFPTPQAVEVSRRYLSGLVREINQCINDLTS